MDTRRGDGFLFLNGKISNVISRVISFARGSSSSTKRAEYHDIDIPQAIATYTYSANSSNLHVGGLLLRGCVQVVSKLLEDFHAKVLASIHFIDSLDGSGAPREPRAPQPRSSRKRSVMERTPLASVPENDALLLNGDVLFDLPSQLLLLPAELTNGSRTPSSHRKRGFSTPRAHDSHEEPAFGSIELQTPTRFLDTAEDVKRRRLSSVSEVMDSLRADDGHRRFSGMIGTGAPSLPDSPVDDMHDYFDSGMEPPSPWSDLQMTPAALPPSSTLISTTTLLRTRRTAKVSARSLMDKKGKEGIEISAEDIKARKQWYLEYKPYFLSRRVDLVIKVNKSELLANPLGYSTWYTPAMTKALMKTGEELVVARKTLQNSLEEAVDNTEYFPDMDDFPSDDFGAASPSKPFQTRPRVATSTSVEDRIVGLKKKGSKSASFESIIASSVKAGKVKNFVQLLSLVSSGRAEFHQSTLTENGVREIGFAERGEMIVSF